MIKLSIDRVAIPAESGIDRGLTLVPRRLVLAEVDVDVVEVDSLLRQHPPDAVRIWAEARAEVDDVADVGVVAALAVWCVEGAGCGVGSSVRN